MLCKLYVQSQFAVQDAKERSVENYPKQKSSPPANEDIKQKNAQRNEYYFGFLLSFRHSSFFYGDNGWVPNRNESRPLVGDTHDVDDRENTRTGRL